MIAGSSRTTVAVRIPDRTQLAVLRDRLAAERVGDLAHELGVRLHELVTERASLEEAYMELTADSVEYGVGYGVAVAS